MTGAVHTAQTTTSLRPRRGRDLPQTVTDLTGGDAAAHRHPHLQRLRPAGHRRPTRPARTTTYTYDAYGNKASQTDPDGNLTQYAYDGDGHLLTTTLANYTGSPPGSQAAAPLLEESRAYDPAGRLAAGDRRDGPQHRLLLHRQRAAGAEIQVQPGRVAVVHHRVRTPTTAPGNLTEQWTNNGETDTTYTVDAAGRVTQQVTDPVRPGPHHDRQLHPRRPAGQSVTADRHRRGDADHVVHLRPGRQRAVAVGDRPGRGRPGGLVQADPGLRHRGAGRGQRRAAGHGVRRDLERQRRDRSPDPGQPGHHGRAGGGHHRVVHRGRLGEPGRGHRQRRQALASQAAGTASGFTLRLRRRHRQLAVRPPAGGHSRAAGAAAAVQRPRGRDRRPGRSWPARTTRTPAR